MAAVKINVEIHYCPVISRQQIAAGRDQFGEVGSQEYLREKFAMEAGHIAAMAEQILSF